MIWLVGFIIEIVADSQKAWWMKEREEKKHEEEFITRGLWSVSRHPNYFGEIVLWSGIAVAAAGVLVRTPAQMALGFSGGVLGRLAALAVCAASPVFVMGLLLKVSGVPLSDGKYDEMFGGNEEYVRWRERTPVLVPKVW